MKEVDGRDRDRTAPPPHRDQAGPDPVDAHGSTDTPDADTVATSSGEHTMDHRAEDGEHVADRHCQRAEEFSAAERAHQRHVAAAADEPVGVDRGDSGPARRG
ncbi:MAG: hypothetical protein R2749_21145 [Acidimicrobiales bacterium]